MCGRRLGVVVRMRSRVVADVGDTSEMRTSASRPAPSASARRPQPPRPPGAGWARKGRPDRVDLGTRDRCRWTTAHLVICASFLALPAPGGGVPPRFWEEVGRGARSASPGSACRVWFATRCTGPKTTRRPFGDAAAESDIEDAPRPVCIRTAVDGVGRCVRLRTQTVRRGASEVLGGGGAGREVRILRVSVPRVVCTRLWVRDRALGVGRARGGASRSGSVRGEAGDGLGEGVGDDVEDA